MARSVGRPTIAILGGGVGGTILANLLARSLAPEEAEIVLVDRSGQHIYQPGWLYIPFGDSGCRASGAQRTRAAARSHQTDSWRSSPA